MTDQLPAGFAALEPFVSQWAISGTAARDHARGESTPEQRVAFFEVAAQLIPQALQLLDKKLLGTFDQQEDRLMNLCLSFAHVTMAVEMLGDAEARHAKYRKVMPLTRSPADA